MAVGSHQRGPSFLHLQYLSFSFLCVFQFGLMFVKFVFFFLSVKASQSLRFASPFPGNCPVVGTFFDVSVLS